jgi:hypothetical protein
MFVGREATGLSSSSGYGRITVLASPTMHCILGTHTHTHTHTHTEREREREREREMILFLDNKKITTIV